LIAFTAGYVLWRLLAKNRPVRPVAAPRASFRVARDATRPDAVELAERCAGCEAARASWRATGAALHAEASAAAPASGTINHRAAAAMNASFMAMPPWVGAEP